MKGKRRKEKKEERRAGKFYRVEINLTGEKMGFAPWQPTSVMPLIVQYTVLVYYISYQF